MRVCRGSGRRGREIRIAWLCRGCRSKDLGTEGGVIRIYKRGVFGRELGNGGG